MTRAAVLAILVAASACGGRNVAGTIAKPPEFDPTGQAKCGVAKSQSEPLIVEWPSASRAKLETMTRKGVIAVRYQGCEMQVLGTCRAPGSYSYAPTTRKRDRITINDADELYANVPVGAAKLEGKLATYGQLNVSMTIVGRYEADKLSVAASDLEGDCEGATHVITGLTTGAFKFVAGAGGEVSSTATVVGAGASGNSTSTSEILNEDGDESSCSAAGLNDKAPPYGCGALLRIEVVPLGTPKKPMPTCPSGTTWDGKQCVGSKIVTSVTCPPGATWTGYKCVAGVECPAGTTWNGQACAGNAPAAGTGTTSGAKPPPPTSSALACYAARPTGTLFALPNVSVHHTCHTPKDCEFYRGNAANFIDGGALVWADVSPQCYSVASAFCYWSAPADGSTPYVDCRESWIECINAQQFAKQTYHPAKLTVCREFSSIADAQKALAY